MDVDFEKSPLEIPSSLQGERLDKALTLLLPPLTRSRIQQLLAEGHVTTEGDGSLSPSLKVQEGQVYYVHVPELEEALPVPQEIPLTILYEDDHLLVLDKQVGLVVHPAPGAYTGTLVNALLYHCGDSLSGINGVKRPGIVHRLDKDTSGLMVVAKSDLAHQGLSEQFADRTLSRRYLALVWGIPEKEGEIIAPIGRSRSDRKKMAVTHSNSKEAVTAYQSLESFIISKSLHQCVTLIECKLRTGRTHQIRVHLTHRGHSLIGDSTYGKTPKGLDEKLNFLRVFPRQALHAHHLEFIHPITHAPMSFTSEVPSDFAALLEKLRGSL